METLKINPKVLATVVLSVVVIADLVPAPSLGPGLLVSSYHWVSSHVRSHTETPQSGQTMRARRSLQNHSQYHQ